MEWSALFAPPVSKIHSEDSQRWRPLGLICPKNLLRLRQNRERLSVMRRSKRSLRILVIRWGKSFGKSKKTILLTLIAAVARIASQCLDALTRNDRNHQNCSY